MADLSLIRAVAGVATLAALLAWETCRPFFPFFGKGWRERSEHLVRNLAVALLNAALAGALFYSLWGQTAVYSDAVGYGMLHRASLTPWAHALAAILLLDVWTYWWHRANHRVSFLWRFHRMHHSDPHMDVTSARRFHPGEILMSSTLRVPIILLFGIHLWQLVFYELLMSAVVDFHHANIGLPEAVDCGLRTVIVTPAMHKVHHSRIQTETDSNYTSLLSVWDRLFGSFRLRADLSAVRMGLDEWSAPAQQTLGGMLMTPLRPRLPLSPSSRQG